MHDFFNLGDLGDPATPENVALIDCRDWENPRILSHGEFDRQVDACARAIAARGLARGDRVAILSLNRAEVLIAYFAIMRAGFVAVPANIKFPRETIAFVLDDAQIKFAFCDAAGRALLPAEHARGRLRCHRGLMASQASLIPAPLRPSDLSPAKRRWCFTLPARPAVPRAFRCRTTVSFGRYDLVSARAVMAASGCWWPPRCSI